MRQTSAAILVWSDDGAFPSWHMMSCELTCMSSGRSKDIPFVCKGTVALGLLADLLILVVDLLLQHMQMHDHGRWDRERLKRMLPRQVAAGLSNLQCSPSPGLVPDDKPCQRAVVFHASVLWLCCIANHLADTWTWAALQARHRGCSSCTLQCMGSQTGLRSLRPGCWRW